MQKTVSYLGPDGSWSEICSLVWFKGYARLPCRSFDEALDMVEVGKSDVCVIPVENSIEGPVTQVLDILSDSSLNIIGEKIMKIRHSLLSNSGEIKVVYSHPQAIAQCRKKLRAMLPGADIVPVSSTSEKWEKGMALENFYELDELRALHRITFHCISFHDFQIAGKRFQT